MRRRLFIDIETLPALSESETDEKTALNGDFGRILCIGFIDEYEQHTAWGVMGWDDLYKTFHCDEQQTLTQFWSRLNTFRPMNDRIIGHNIFDFDLKFILKRSIIHGIRPTVELSFARYRNQPIFDTMHEWERWGYGAKISLDKLAKAMNLESSKQDGMDGSQVLPRYLAGDHQSIYDYCLKDVEVTRAIYKRMTFEK